MCAACVECHDYIISFFPIFFFLSPPPTSLPLPPGRFSAIISAFQVCKAAAARGLLCPLYPVLCRGLRSGRHVAPPVRPLSRCLQTRVRGPRARPPLQPVYQPGLYSRYNITDGAAQPHLTTKKYIYIYFFELAAEKPASATAPFVAATTCLPPH